MLRGNLTCAAVALLLSPSAVPVAAAQNAAHAAHSSLNGPLPDAVRNATDRYRDVNNAVADGYVQFQGCVSGPERGAMGVHYAKFALFDGALDVSTPEVLVYEPRNGGLHLVAAEYVADAAAWHAVHPSDQPQLMGHLLQFAPGPNRYGPDAFYELHVWAWRQNPSGTFADWNPRVSCVSWGGLVP